MQWRHHYGKEWRIDILPAARVCHLIGIAAIEHGRAGFCIDGEIGFVDRDIVRIDTSSLPNVGEPPDNDRHNNCHDGEAEDIEAIGGTVYRSCHLGAGFDPQSCSYNCSALIT